MKKSIIIQAKITLIIFLMAFVLNANAQNKVTLKLSSSNTVSTPYLGSLTSTARDAIVSPVVGSQIFNTTNGYLEYYDSFWGWMPIHTSNEWKRKYGFEYFRDFPNGNNDGYMTSILSNSGSILSNAAPGTTSEQSMTASLNTNALANGAASFLSNGSTLVLGSGTTVYEARVYFPILSTSTDRYQTVIGLHDNPTGPNQVDGVYILYDEGGASTSSTASPNFQIVSTSNNIRSFQISNVVVTATTWYNIRIEVNAAGTTAKLYINGTQVGTDVTTNIPTGQARSMGFGVTHVKSVGTTNRQVLLNLIDAKQKYTNAR